MKLCCLGVSLRAFFDQHQRFRNLSAYKLFFPGYEIEIAAGTAPTGSIWSGYGTVVVDGAEWAYLPPSQARRHPHGTILRLSSVSSDESVGPA